MQLGMALQTGECSSHAGSLPSSSDAAAVLSSTCDAISAHDQPDAGCCQDIAAFGAAGCACDADTLALAQSLGGMSPDALKAAIRKASAVCGKAGIGIPDTCGFATCA